jgi:hypothetical protein
MRLAWEGTGVSTHDFSRTTASIARIGTISWSEESSGALTGKERRQLLRPLARVHLQNVVGRTAMALRLNSGLRAAVPEHVLRPPSSVLARAAQDQAHRRLTPALLGHSYRCYHWGVALGWLEQIDVDRELLFAAAMLHDTGLTRSERGVEFTLRSAGIAREVAEAVGLTRRATETLRTAITLHHSPDVSLGDGPVAYLLSAGAAVDVVGMRAWQLPSRVLRSVLAEQPRLGFKREFRLRWAAEATAVPRGRAQLLRRYGALDLAIRLAPFAD